MKKLFTLLVTIVFTVCAFSQAPQKMSYQAVIRDGDNKLVTNFSVGMRVSILQGSITGTEVYKEIYNPNPQTNANGLLTTEIGSGLPLTGTFAAIDWSAGPYYIKTETDPTGGTDYTIVGTSQLLSVPYALHAKTADSITGIYNETDPIYDASDASGITSTDITNWNNKLDVEVDGSVTNEIQSLSISNNELTISGGNTVVLPTKGSTKIVSHPFEAWASEPISELNLNRGYTRATLGLRAWTTSVKTLYVLVNLPSTINDVPQKLESITINYHLNNASSFITATYAYIRGLGGASFAISDLTDRTSTAWTTYTLTDPSPNAVTGCVILKFDLNFVGTGYSHDIEIGTITLTLTN